MQQSTRLPFPSYVWAIAVGLALALAAAAPAQAQGSSPEAAFLALINDYRADSERCWTGDAWRSWSSDATHSLTRSATLDEAAQSHNATMIDSGCFAHQCEGEADLTERVEAAGYPSTWRHLSENIAGGFESAQAVFNGWRNSGSHNKTMLDCRMRAIGIARTPAPQSEYRWFWTTDFGDVVDAAPQGDGSSDEEDGVVATLTEFDANRNDRIDRPEFNAIVAAWNAGHLSDRAVQKAYELYRSGEQLSGASVPALLSVSQRANHAAFAINARNMRQLNVHIYGLSGDLVYDGQTSHAELVWRLQTNQGEPVANGVYLYVIQADTAQGTHTRVGRLTVLH